MRISDLIFNETGLDGGKTRVSVGVPYGNGRIAQIQFTVDAQARVEHEKVADLELEHFSQIKQAIESLKD